MIKEIEKLASKQRTPIPNVIVATPGRLERFGEGEEAESGKRQGLCPGRVRQDVGSDW